MKNVKNLPKTIKIGSRFIGEGHPTLFIAEIGANFDGNLEKAKKLVLAAKESGADVAKFQTFSTPKIVSEKGFSKMKLRGVHGSWGRTVNEVFKDAEFPREWHKIIADYCKKVGIMFSSAAYDFEGVDLLDSLEVPFFKIGSGDITWHEILKYTAKKGRPIMLGTGASTLAEVSEAVKVITDTGNKKLVLLQCITNYPSKIESANINVLKTYQGVFGVITGYSDHTPGDIVPLGAVALGGKVIEKHFTLNKKDKGPDHPHSLEPYEFKEMVGKIRELEKALGSTIKKVVEEESETVVVQRRSLCLNRNLVKGSVIKESDLIELRPALGILPKLKKNVIGLTVKKNLYARDLLYWTAIR